MIGLGGKQHTSCCICEQITVAIQDFLLMRQNASPIDTCVADDQVSDSVIVFDPGKNKMQPFLSFLL